MANPIKIQATDGITTIIDGVSDVFKIVFGGSFATTTIVTATITGLGSFSAAPAYISNWIDNHDSNGFRRVGPSATALGAYNQFLAYAEAVVGLSGSTPTITVFFSDTTGSGDTITAYFYLLLETTI